MHLLHLSFGIEFRFWFGFGSVKSLYFGFGSVSVKSRFGRSLHFIHIRLTQILNLFGISALFTQTNKPFLLQSITGSPRNVWISSTKLP